MADAEKFRRLAAARSSLSTRSIVQQGAAGRLLPYVERGDIILIGATTRIRRSK